MLRQLKRRLGNDLTVVLVEQIEALDWEQIEALAEALLDFATGGDVR